MGKLIKLVDSDLPSSRIFRRVYSSILKSYFRRVVTVLTRESTDIINPNLELLQSENIRVRDKSIARSREREGKRGRREKRENRREKGKSGKTSVTRVNKISTPQLSTGLDVKISIRRIRVGTNFSA